MGLFNQNKINRGVAEHKERLPKKYSANSDKVFGSCCQFCASMELTEGIDFSKSVFFGFCEVMFWMILQSHRVHWDSQNDENRIPLWFLVLWQWHKLFEGSKRSRSWRLMSTSSCELCRDLRPWCSCRGPQTELARDVWCWLFKPFGRSRHFC